MTENIKSEIQLEDKTKHATDAAKENIRDYVDSSTRELARLDAALDGTAVRIAALSAGTAASPFGSAAGGFLSRGAGAFAEIPAEGAATAVGTFTAPFVGDLSTLAAGLPRQIALSAAVGGSLGGVRAALRRRGVFGGLAREVQSDTELLRSDFLSDALAHGFGFGAVTEALMGARSQIRATARTHFDRTGLGGLLRGSDDGAISDRVFSLFGSLVEDPADPALDAADDAARRYFAGHGETIAHAGTAAAAAAPGRRRRRLRFRGDDNDLLSPHDLYEGLEGDIFTPVGVRAQARWQRFRHDLSRFDPAQAAARRGGAVGLLGRTALAGRTGNLAVRAAVGALGGIPLGVAGFAFHAAQSYASQFTDRTLGDARAAAAAGVTVSEHGQLSQAAARIGSSAGELTSGVSDLVGALRSSGGGAQRSLLGVDRDASTTQILSRLQSVSQQLSPEQLSRFAEKLGVATESLSNLARAGDIAAVATTPGSLAERNVRRAEAYAEERGRLTSPFTQASDAARGLVTGLSTRGLRQINDAASLIGNVGVQAFNALGTVNPFIGSEGREFYHQRYAENIVRNEGDAGAFGGLFTNVIPGLYKDHHYGGRIGDARRRREAAELADRQAVRRAEIEIGSVRSTGRRPRGVGSGTQVQVNIYGADDLRFEERMTEILRRANIPTELKRFNG